MGMFLTHLEIAVTRNFYMPFSLDVNPKTVVL